MIDAKIIEDSVAPNGVRLVTLQLCYPRFIHSELMTHRVFSRNAMSSRAVPVAKMIEQVRTNPASPVHWGANQPGMQAAAELTGKELYYVQLGWKEAAENAALVAEAMSLAGAHKQVVNRILEPFQWMHTIVTATEWDNFFSLRCHPAAEPNFQKLANTIRNAMKVSRPIQKAFDSTTIDGWHLPYIRQEERTRYRDPWMLAKLSAARCARVSYKNHDGSDPDIIKDMELARSLFEQRHMSPFEHQAFPLFVADQTSRNFRGWRQYRERIEAEFPDLKQKAA